MHTKIQQKIRFTFILISFFAVFSSVSYANEGKSSLYPLRITTQKGTILYKVEIARTYQEHKRGLMHRTELAENHGMIFLHNNPQVLRMWMKNTLIGLDMVFIDQYGSVRHIHEGAIPHDETVISSVHAVVAVLELNAGAVVRDQIRIGDEVILGVQP